VFPIPVGSPSALATRANAVPGVVRTVALAAGVLAAGAVIPALAQATRHEARPAVRAVPPVARDAVTAPVAPDVINRDASGRVAIRATRLDTALTIDGHLDESTYRQVKSFGGFIQQEPQEGRPSSVSTDVWVFFDDQAVYVAARCWQDASLPLVANDLRRDGPTLTCPFNLQDREHDHCFGRADHKVGGHGSLASHRCTKWGILGSRGNSKPVMPEARGR